MSHRNPKLELGDTVTIRDWGDMAEEFGTHDGGRVISMPFSFTNEMNKFCSKKAMILTINYSSSQGIEKYGLGFNGSAKVDYYFGIEMFKPKINHNAELQEKLRHRGEFDEALI